MTGTPEIPTPQTPAEARAAWVAAIQNLPGCQDPEVRAMAMTMAAATDESVEAIAAAVEKAPKKVTAPPAPAEVHMDAIPGSTPHRS